MVTLKDAYRAGTRVSDVWAAERLCAREDPTKPETIRCRENRQRFRSESREVYESSNFVGKIAYLTGLCTRHLWAAYITDDLVFD